MTVLKKTVARGGFNHGSKDIGSFGANAEHRKEIE